MSLQFTIHSDEFADVDLSFTSGEPFIDLDQVKGRPDDETLRQMEKNVAVKAAIQRSLNTKRWYAALIRAKGQCAILRFARDAAQNRLSGAKDALKRTEEVHYPLLILMAASVVVALFVEVGLTWSVLPAFLNIPAYSVLGFAMGGLTLVLTVALEQALDPALRSLEGGLKEPTSASSRLVKQYVAGGIIASIVILNAIVLIKLGLAREEAARLLQLLSDMAVGTVPKSDSDVSTSMVVWVGVVTVLDSALVIRQLMRALQNCFSRLVAQFSVLKNGRDLMSSQRALTLAEIKETSETQWFDSVEQHSRDLSEATESRDRALLEEIRRRRWPEPKASLAAVVNEILVPGHYIGTVNGSENSLSSQTLQ